MELRSGLGEIVVELPPGFSGEFDLEVKYTRRSDQDYQIINDFGLNVVETPNWTTAYGQQVKLISATGIVGGGGRRIKISTTNANIVVRSK